MCVVLGRVKQRTGAVELLSDTHMCLGSRECVVPLQEHGRAPWHPGPLGLLARAPAASAKPNQMDRDGLALPQLAG